MPFRVNAGGVSHPTTCLEWQQEGTGIDSPKRCPSPASRCQVLVQTPTISFAYGHTIINVAINHPVVKVTISELLGSVMPYVTRESSKMELVLSKHSHMDLDVQESSHDKTHHNTG